MGNTSKILETSSASAQRAADESIFGFDAFQLDPRERTLRRDGELVPLTAKVFDTLVLLVRHAGQLVSKDQLMTALWPDSFVEDANLNQNVSVLRRALGESAQHPRYIVTVPGRGYRFAAPVRSTSLAPAVGTGERSGRVEPPKGSVGNLIPRWLGVVVLTGVMVAATMIGARYRTTSDDGRPYLDPQKFQISRVTESGRAPSAAVSLDGRYVAYIEYDGDQYSLWVKQLATGGRTQVLSPDAAILTHVTFSPDGNYLYFTRRSASQPGAVLYQIPALGGTERLILKDVDTPISFSPDGQQFVFMRGASNGEYQIVIAASSGGHERILASRTTPLMFLYVGPAWSPDGRTVAASAADHGNGSRWSVDLLSVADGSSRSLYSSKSLIGRVRWMPDGTGVLTVVSETLSRQFPSWQAGTQSHVSGGTIWHIAYPDGRATKLTNDLTDYDICCVDAAADGSTITTVQNSLVSDLWIAPADHLDTPRQITWGDPVFRRHAWLPDNDTIVYRDLSGHLNSVHKDGRTVGLPLADGQKVVSGVSACGDGRFLVFASIPGNSIWRIEPDGSNATRLTSGHMDSGPACSPDGRWTVYSSVTSGFPSIWQVPTEGGEPTPVVEDQSLEALPSPSGRLMYYFAIEWEPVPVPVRHMRWVVISARDRKRLYSFERPVNAALGLSPVWAPDETGLDYVVTRAGVSNVWRQPLQGGAPTQITHFASGQIFSLAWSPDGRWLSLGSGANRSDVVLIRAAR